MFDIENKAAAFNRAGAEPEIVAQFEAVVEDWCKGTEKLLAETDSTRVDADDAGPETELDYWRNRMAKFNSITEQLKGRECKVVLGVLSAAKSKVLKRWKLLDNGITDANNEAKDNVKYLSTLEKYIEPLSTGTPLTILDALPGLLNNIKMMHTIARCAPRPSNPRPR
jgi:dynein heavy chain